MGRLNYSDAAALAVPTQGPTDSSTAAASTAFVQAVVPAGVVFPYAGTVAPVNFLLCDGSLVSRTTFAALFSAIGSTYGAGDGSTTFKLPDLRGKFIRALDNGAGVDSGRALGSSQADQTRDHQHGMTTWTGVALGKGGTAAATAAPLATVGDGGLISSSGSTNVSPPSTAVTTQGVYGIAVGETRPTNVALNHIIKAY